MRSPSFSVKPVHNQSNGAFKTLGMRRVTRRHKEAGPTAQGQSTTLKGTRRKWWGQPAAPSSSSSSYLRAGPVKPLHSLDWGLGPVLPRLTNLQKSPGCSKHLPLPNFPTCGSRDCLLRNSFPHESMLLKPDSISLVNTVVLSCFFSVKVPQISLRSKNVEKSSRSPEKPTLPNNLFFFIVVSTY